MRAIVIIQARMGSARLPGKVLEDLAGRPMLHHIIERSDEFGLPVVVATSTAAGDDAVADYAQRLGVAVVRGPEADVLERFLLVVRRLRLKPFDAVVRVCADAPLWDPGFIARCMAMMHTTGANMVVGDVDGPCVYQGAEVVRVAALEWSAREAGDDPRAREHVTAWVRSRPEARVLRIGVPGWTRRDLKLSVDTAEDLERMRGVYGRLYRPGRIVQLREAVGLLTGGEA